MYEIVKNCTKFTYRNIISYKYDMLEFLNSLTLIVNSLKKKYERIIINTSLKVIVLLAQKSLIHWIS